LKPHEILHQYWGYKEFRPLQEEIIESILQGKDTLALLPTGGGKSICFQIPALMNDGICIVVSPLIALMKDQVENLNKRDIKAKAIYSGMSYREINITLENCIHGDIKFLYLSPERLKSELVRDRISQMNVNLLAVDEAHCISQWGYDFRPEYLQIDEIKSILKKTPILALTATATPDVIKDIQHQLNFSKPNVFIKSFERSNLSYVVNTFEDKDKRLLTIISKVKGTVLVYVRNRRKTQEIAMMLLQNHERADYYHAGLPHALRIKKQEDWTQNKIRVMVCTNAFGMGIDKPDVRLVIHYEMPESLESYYQEAGRAGRDEQKSYCVLLFNHTDEVEAQHRLELNFPEEKEIRRVYQALCNYYSMPVGADVDRSFDFDIADFCKKFSIAATIAYPSLKILEQCDLISLSDGFYEPSKIKFLLHQEELYKFQVEHPSYDDFIKLVLRSYGGVFDQYIIINEKLLAQRVNKEAEFIISFLEKLHQLQVLDFQKQKNLPQITFTSARVDAANFSFNNSLIKKRKETATTKLNAMLSYAKNTSVCRSKKLLEYFDEFGGTDCGVCDVCLERIKLGMKDDEFEGLIEKIRIIVTLKNTSLHELIDSIKEEKEEKIIETVRFLLDSDKLHYNSSQYLVWKN
jgi:ATP-dependent DNA helicase RecQ